MQMGERFLKLPIPAAFLMPVILIDVSDENAELPHPITFQGQTKPSDFEKQNYNI